jgi:hypothetical protein
MRFGHCFAGLLNPVAAHACDLSCQVFIGKGVPEITSQCDSWNENGVVCGFKTGDGFVTCSKDKQGLMILSKFDRVSSNERQKSNGSGDVDAARREKLWAQANRRKCKLII